VRLRIVRKSLILGLLLSSPSSWREALELASQLQILVAGFVRQKLVDGPIYKANGVGQRDLQASRFRSFLRQSAIRLEIAVWKKNAMADELTNGQDVCAITVAYHPDEDFPARIERILREVGALVIVNNGADDAELRMLRDLATNSLITLISNAENVGIARALNIGVWRAMTLGFKWALLLDQDSWIDDDMVQTLIAASATYPDRDRLGVIGAGYREVDVPLQRATGESVDVNWEEVASVITSGSLIPLKAHAAIGAFREDFFIDHVDTEYCFRARAMGYGIIRTRRAIMSHTIGAISRHQVLWMKKWTFNHAADRRYYIARNDTVMLREFGHHMVGLWALKSFGRCVRLCKRIALYEQKKTYKIVSVAQGWWDGVRGNMGPRSDRQ
jgi:rhamnosyltransferase